MKENFLTSMLSEGGKISHKRVISVAMATAAIFMIIYATLHYKEFIVHFFDWTLVFILVMSGVATVAQIISALRGTPEKDEPKPDQP